MKTKDVKVNQTYLKDGKKVVIARRITPKPTRQNLTPQTEFLLLTGERVFANQLSEIQ